MNTLFNKVFGGCNMILLNDSRFMRMLNGTTYTEDDPAPDELADWLHTDWTQTKIVPSGILDILDEKQLKEWKEKNGFR